jgi:hypothetical protein
MWDDPELPDWVHESSRAAQSRMEELWEGKHQDDRRFLAVFVGLTVVSIGLGAFLSSAVGWGVFIPCFLVYGLFDEHKKRQHEQNKEEVEESTAWVFHRRLAALVPRIAAIEARGRRFRHRCSRSSDPGGCITSGRLESVVRFEFGVCRTLLPQGVELSGEVKRKASERVIKVEMACVVVEGFYTREESQSS